MFLVGKIEKESKQMKNKKSFLYAIRMAFVILAFTVGYTYAQPSDAKIRKDVMGPKTVSLTFGGPGKVEWSSTYKKYVWNRNFTAKVKTDEPGVFLTVKGYASYEVMGKSYVFWRTFTSSNSYEGIPNPSAADVQGLIKRFGVKEFMGDYQFRQMIGDVESIGLSKDPKFEWHTANSVSFDIVAAYTKKGNGNNTPSEHVEENFRIRLYRDGQKDEWKSIHSTWTRSRAR